MLLIPHCHCQQDLDEHHDAKIMAGLIIVRRYFAVVACHSVGVVVPGAAMGGVCLL